jgi:hypothetical protein
MAGRFDQLKRFGFLISLFLGVDFCFCNDGCVRKKLLRFATRLSPGTVITPVEFFHFVFSGSIGVLKSLTSPPT